MLQIAMIPLNSLKRKGNEQKKSANHRKIISKSLWWAHHSDCDTALIHLHHTVALWKKLLQEKLEYGFFLPEIHNTAKSIHSPALRLM